MIFGFWHEGSGLGDQLFRYITVRSLAEKKGYDWGMRGEFKGDFFLNFNRGKSVEGNTEYAQFREKEVRENGVDIRSYDPEINFISNWTAIDGSFEDDKYWRSNLGNISKWLLTPTLEVPNTRCLIGFRGGEYKGISELFLTEEYWETAKAEIMRLRPNLSQWEVHTDDPQAAKEYIFNANIIDNQQISHSKHTNMGLNWASMRYAKYAIIPNSAFFILPRILKHQEDPSAVTIAPRYWAGRNHNIWKRPACYYPEFLYV